MLHASFLATLVAIAQASAAPAVSPSPAMMATPAPAKSAMPAPPLKPASGSQSSPAIPPSDTGNGYTQSGPVGPQQNLGKPIPHYIRYVAGDIIAPPIIYNEYIGGFKGSKGRNYDLRGALEFPVGPLTLMAMVDSRNYQYGTTNAIVTGIGGVQSFVPAQTNREHEIDGRVGIKLIDPRIYAGVSYLRVQNNYGYPTRKGIGYGIEKLPDLDQNFSLHGGVWLYPNVGGNITFPAAPVTLDLSYKVVKYSIGASIQLEHTPLFIDAGFLGDRGVPRTNAPVRYQHQGPYVGLGLHF
ncbi:MAG: hypothetical protein NVSMB64_19610 [Candidatus Velthaea sp.]